MSGYYLMHRGWQDNPVFRNEEFSRRDAFVWLIEEACFRETRIHAGGKEITLERGQLSHSLRYMARAWKWDEARVRRFLSSLSKTKIIDASSDAGQTIITICNYDKYQAPEKEPDAPADAAATQQRRGGAAKKKEGKEYIPSEDKSSSGINPRAKSNDPLHDPPEDIPAEPWSGFVAMRRKIKKPLTPRAAELVFRKLRKLRTSGHDPGDVLDQSTMNSWQNVYEIKDLNEGKRVSNHRASGGNGRRNPAFDMFDELRAEIENEPGDSGDHPRSGETLPRGEWH